MKLLRITALATMLGLSSAVCATASTDSNYVCMISGAGINVHWKTDTAGNYYEMMVDAPQTGAAGFTGVGWNPTNPTGNKMIGSTILMGGTGDLTTVKRYSPADTVQANVLATLTTIPATITQTAITSANSRITLKFRRTGVSTGSLLTIFAYGNTGTLTAHTSTNRAASTINLADGIRLASTPSPQTATSCAASTLIQTGTTTYDCMLALSAAVTIHWNRETTATNTAMAASAAAIGGWLAIGFPTVATSMTPATAVSSNSATTAGIFAITARSAAGIAATTSPNLNTATTELVNGQRIIRFNVLTSFLADNMPVNYAVHTSNVQFPIASAQHTSRGSSAVNFAAGTAQSVVGARDFEEVRTHGGAMIAIWAYWVPLAIVIKGAGPLVCKGKVCEFPIPFVIHIAMMFIAMSLTTVFAAIALSEFDNDVEYGHREIGIVILSIGWVQVLGGIAKPANDSSFRIYWGWGHLLFGFSIFILAVVQMAYGYKNLETLYANEDIDPMKHALIAGLVAFGTIYIGCRIYMIVTKEEEKDTKEDSSSSHSNPPDKQ